MCQEGNKQYPSQLIGNRNLGKQKLMIQIGEGPEHGGLTCCPYEESHKILGDLRRPALLFVKNLCKSVLRHYEKYLGSNIV